MCFCLVSMTMVFSASPKFRLGLGLNYTLFQPAEVPDINNAQHKLGVEISPYFSYDKFSMQLDGYIFFDVGLFPPHFNPWWNNWLPPVRESEESDFSYAMRVASHYSGIIRYITWGKPSDDIYFRWGKLTSATLGDGALLRAYQDTTVDKRATRPGITLKLDAKAFHFPWLGFEFFTDDIFHPSLFGSRLFVRPCTSTEIPIIKDMQVGISFITDPYGHVLQVKDPADGTETVQKVDPITNAALDVMFPLLSQKWIGLTFYSDFIMQFPNQSVQGMSHAFRVGMGGSVTPWILFNGAVIFPTGNGFVPDYFETGFNKLTPADIAGNRLDVGAMRFEGRLGVQVLDSAIYAGMLAQADYSSKDDWNNYRFGMRLHIDQELLRFIGLDFTYDKTYPKHTDTQETEPFGQGLTTLKNVSIGLDVLVKINPVDFDLGLSMAFDQDGMSTGLNFEVGLKFSFF